MNKEHAHVAIKAQRQALGLQRKLESELDRLDVTDRYYDRKYESLSRRLDETFAAIEEAEQKIADCKAKIESVKKQGMSKDSICESLKLFDKLYDKMNDHEKKRLVNAFIDRIELYPDIARKKGNPIRKVVFKFPVSYEGESVFEVLSPRETTDEMVVLISFCSLDFCFKSSSIPMYILFR